MESVILRVISLTSAAVQRNIITLIAAYEWKSSVYFVFPFVECDLGQILRGSRRPSFVDARDADTADDPLPSYWLWTQMAGVCNAMSAIHTDLKDPFNDNKRVIAFHFDLKPANILVTREGVLKITDFGQSIIQDVLDGKEHAEEYPEGDFAYQPPESKPSRHELKEARDRVTDRATKVLLNYDVWALACIMTEVLTYYFARRDRPELACRQLDGQRAEEDLYSPYAYYSTDREGGSHFLKRCVRGQLDWFGQQRPQDHPEGEYISAVVDLLLCMFEVTPQKRCFSHQVVQSLDDAAKAFSRRCAGGAPDDDVCLEDGLFDPGEGFVELGWSREESIASFAHM